MSNPEYPPEIRKDSAPQVPRKKRRGYLDGETVRAVTFGVITLCIVISVVACVLGIWEVAKSGVLWRTAATCIVIAGGMMAFAVINSLFGPRE